MFYSCSRSSTHIKHLNKPLVPGALKKPCGGLCTVVFLRSVFFLFSPPPGSSSQACLDPKPPKRAFFYRDLNHQTRIWCIVSKKVKGTPKIVWVIMARPIYHPSKGTSFKAPVREPLLRGSWLAINGVISPLIGVISIVTLIITHL